MDHEPEGRIVHQNAIGIPQPNGEIIVLKVVSREIPVNREEDRDDGFSTEGESDHEGDVANQEDPNNIEFRNVQELFEEEDSLPDIDAISLNGSEGSWSDYEASLESLGITRIENWQDSLAQNGAGGVGDGGETSQGYKAFGASQGREEK